MTNMERVIVFAAAAVACLGGPAFAGGPDDTFRALYQREWQFRLQEFPEMATAEGDHRYDDRLTHVGARDLERRYHYYQDVERKLAGINESGLSPGEQVNFAIYRRQIRHFLTEHETGAELIPLNSDWGFYLSLSRLPSEVPLDSVADYRNYVARLRSMPAVIDEYILLLKRGLKAGMTPPRVVLKGREAIIRAIYDTPLAKNAFYRPFLHIGQRIPNARRKPLVEQGRSIVETRLNPTFARLFDFFVQRYVPGARTTLAATALPDGARFYREQVRYYTTLDLKPEEIHRIGLAEVKRIQSDMKSIITEVGFKGGFAAFLHFLRTDPRFYAKTPAQLLRIASRIAKRIDGTLPAFFRRLPRQPYGVEPVPESLAPTFTAGRYVGAPIDSKRAGTYWVNTYDLPSRPLYTLPALTLHEAVPGHHLQGALAAEQKNQPPFRRNAYISAYGEGWGLYAEFLGQEMGIYQTPYEQFGRLTYEMWRACRLVVDTGIHTQGWSREKAIDYLASHTALSTREVTTEVDRYISWPGQALSYKLGEMEIRKLRREAESALGEKFDLRGFHDTVLSLGSVPLDVLATHVHRWIARQRGKARGQVVS